MHFVEQSSCPRKSISEIAKKNNTSGYHPEIESTRDVDTIPKGMRNGHQPTSSGNVTARICPKAWAPLTIGDTPESTRKQKAIIVSTKDGRWRTQSR